MAKLKAVLRRRWPILLVTLLIGAIAGLASSRVGPERGVTYYQAEQVIVANRLSGNPASVSQDSLKVNRGQVPVEAAKILERPDDASALARKVQAKASTDSNSIRLTVYDTDPKKASQIVQAFSAAFLNVVNADLRSEDTRQLEELQRRYDDASDALEAFDEENGYILRSDVVLPQTVSVDALIAERRRLDDAVSKADNQLSEAELKFNQRAPYSSLGVEKPHVADSQMIEVPSSPLFRAGLLGMLGLALGAGLVILIERVNVRVDTRDELAQLVDFPIIAEIGSIPMRERPASADGEVSLEGVWSEHYRRVRSAIEFVQTDAGRSLTDRSGQELPGHVISAHQSASGGIPRVFLFASALPGEGKSTSVALTGMALAEVEVETLVLNADFRRPKVEKYLGVPTSPSLADRSEMTSDRLSVNEIVQPANQDHLWVASAGPPTHEVGGRLRAAKEVVEAAVEQDVTVLIDSSPLRVSNDPIDVLSYVDEVILIVRAGRTTVKSLMDTIELLEMHHAPVLGVILIGTLATREMYAYYQSYYQAMEAREDEKRRAKQASSAPGDDTDGGSGRSGGDGGGGPGGGPDADGSDPIGPAPLNGAVVDDEALVGEGMLVGSGHHAEDVEVIPPTYDRPVHDPVPAMDSTSRIVPRSSSTLPPPLPS